MRGEGRVRGGVGHSTIGFISEIAFGNWFSGLLKTPDFVTAEVTRLISLWKPRIPPCVGCHFLWRAVMAPPKTFPTPPRPRPPPPSPLPSAIPPPPPPPQRAGHTRPPF